MRLTVAMAGLFLASAGCKPAPDEIRVSARSPQSLVSTGGETSARITEGDVLVLDAVAEMGELCIDGTSSQPTVATLRPVRGNCRVFVVSATSPGRAILQFEARGTTETLTLDVLPLP